METFEQRLKGVAQNAQNRMELMDKVHEVVNDIMQVDGHLYSIDKSWAGYGTWRVTFWCNEYRFGDELTKQLKKLSLTTQDEERTFSIEDFRERIEDVMQEMALEWF